MKSSSHWILWESTLTHQWKVEIMDREIKIKNQGVPETLWDGLWMKGVCIGRFVLCIRGTDYQSL